MSTTDPRAWLAEAQERAEKDHACYRCRLTRREHQPGYSASRCTFIASPQTDPDKAAMAAALVAVLDQCERGIKAHGVAVPDDIWEDGYNSGRVNALNDVRHRIAEHLAKGDA